MAGRKWTPERTIETIAEAARSVRADERPGLQEAIAAFESLPAMDDIALRSFAARVARSAWKERLFPQAMTELARTVRSAQEIGPTLGASQAATLTVIGDLIAALRDGDQALLAPASPDDFERPARNAARGRSAPDSICSPLMLRKVIEPLLNGDRAAFRALLGAVGGAAMILDTAAVTGGRPGAQSLPLYRELVAMQSALNGLLHASRSRVTSSSGTAAGVRTA